jgi:hypothetical protein
MPCNVNHGLTLSETTRHVVLLGHSSLLFGYRPVLIRHRGLGEIEKRADIGYKLDGLVHRVEADGVLQEEEIRLVTAMPFHLTDQRLLLLPIHAA